MPGLETSSWMRAKGKPRLNYQSLLVCKLLSSWRLAYGKWPSDLNGACSPNNNGPETNLSPNTDTPETSIPSQCTRPKCKAFLQEVSPQHARPIMQKVPRNNAAADSSSSDAETQVLGETSNSMDPLSGFVPSLSLQASFT